MRFGTVLRQKLREIGVSAARIPKVVREMKRKGFHASGMIIPLIYYFAQKYGYMTHRFACVVLGSIAFLYLLWDLLRLKVPSVALITTRYFGFMMREKEKDRLTGVTYYLFGTFSAILLCSPVIAVTAMAFLIFGDFAAALIGISFGRIKLRPLLSQNKSLEGSLACFVTCLLIGLATFSAALGVTRALDLALYGALAATLAELLPFLDDNLSIPLVSGAVMQFSAYRLGLPL